MQIDDEKFVDVDEALVARNIDEARTREVECRLVDVERRVVVFKRLDEAKRLSAGVVEELQPWVRAVEEELGRRQERLVDGDAQRRVAQRARDDLRREEDRGRADRKRRDR